MAPPYFKKPSHLHDTLFKAIFSVAEYFAAFLREHTSPALRAEFDDRPPKLLNPSFSARGPKQYHIDLFYRVWLKPGPKREKRRLYVPLEHKSRPSETIHLQMLGYLLMIWSRFPRRDRRRGLRMQLVIPIVVYNGRQRWRVPECFAEQFEDYGGEVAATARAMAGFSHKLVNLRRLTLERLSSHRELWALLVILRGDPWVGARAAGAEEVLAAGAGARAGSQQGRKWEEQARRDLLLRVVKALPLRRDEPLISEAVNIALDYVSWEWQDGASEYINQQLPLLRGEEGETQVTTYAERWYAENAEPIYAEGKAEGLAKGRAEGQAETLLKQLRLRYGDLPEWANARVEQASANEIEVWTERVLTAPTLDAVFSNEPLPPSTHLNGKP